MDCCWDSEWQAVLVDVMLRAMSTVVERVLPVQTGIRRRLLCWFEFWMLGSTLHIRSGFGPHDLRDLPHEYSGRLP